MKFSPARRMSSLGTKLLAGMQLAVPDLQLQVCWYDASTRYRNLEVKQHKRSQFFISEVTNSILMHFAVKSGSRLGEKRRM
jgi:hypothetical protein